MTIGRWFGFAALVACCALCAGAARAELKIGGYTQARYNAWDDDAGNDDSFDLRRVYVKLEGDINEQTSFKVQLDLGKFDDDEDQEIKLKDALITRRFSSAWTGSLGFTSVPFGYEVPASNSTLLPLERSRIARWFFPGERNTALTVRHQAGKRSPEFTLGYGNGLVDWYDLPEQDDADALFGRVQFPLQDKGVAGASVMFANRHIDTLEPEAVALAAAAPGDYDDTVWGAHVRYRVTPQVAVQAELYSGQILGVDLAGGYAQVEAALPNTSTTAFYRYDSADYESKADVYTGHTLGAAYDLSKQERVTAQVEMLDTEKGASLTNFALQYQVKY